MLKLRIRRLNVRLAHVTPMQRLLALAKVVPVRRRSVRLAAVAGLLLLNTACSAYAGTATECTLFDRNGQVVMAAGKLAAGGKSGVCTGNLGRGTRAVLTYQATGWDYYCGDSPGVWVEHIQANGQTTLSCESR